jgi:hypothetical protein
MGKVTYVHLDKSTNELQPLTNMTFLLLFVPWPITRAARLQRVEQKLEGKG